MKRGKWIAAVAALAIGLSAGAAAEEHHGNRQERDEARYSQRDNRDRAQVWNNGYRDNDDRYRDNDQRSRGREWREQEQRRDRNQDRSDRDHDRGNQREWSRGPR
jgi:hypothetical protein